MSDEKPRRSILSRLVPYFRPHLWRLGLAAITLLVVTGVHLARPMILREIVDTAIPNRDLDLAKKLALGFVGLLVLGGGALYLRVRLLARMGAEIVARIKDETFTHVLNQGMRFFDQNQVGKLITRTESDANQMNALFTGAAAQIFSSSVLLVAILAMILREQPVLGGVATVIMLIVGVVLYFYVGYIRGMYRLVREKNSEMTAYVTEYIQGIPLIRLYCREDAVRRRLVEYNMDKALWERKAGWIDYVYFSPIFRIVTENVLLFVLFLLGSREIYAGRMTVGTLIMILELMRQFLQPLHALAEVASQIQTSLAAASRVFDVIDTPIDVPDDGQPAPDLRLQTTLAFRNVAFAYKAEPVLHDLSFDVTRGQHLAIVGASGSGKTTCINLLLRFYNPTSGRITIDGRDIATVRLADWRKRIALVLQEMYLFPGTIIDNLKAFSPEVPDEQVIAAAQRIGAHEFIMKQPNGYKTELTERGANLSLGERQLLSYTRALVRDPDLLILDEATSSVDPITERMLQASMMSLMQGRTAIIIAHRLSTIRHADNILVLEGGRLVEQGSHQALIDRNGIYTRLVNLQSVEAAPPPAASRAAAPRGTAPALDEVIV